MNKKADYVDYPINFLWIALAVCLLGLFVIGLGNLYGMSSTEMLNDHINVTLFMVQINQSVEISDSVYNSTTQDDLNTNTNVLSIGSMWGTIKTMPKIIWGTFNLIKVVVVNVLGIPSFVYYTIISILMLSLIFAIIKLIVTGT